MIDPLSQQPLVYQPERTVFLVMAGGQGSRLWPLSHEARPKQFVDLLATGMSMLQMTLARLPDGFPLSRVFVNVVPEMVAQVHEQAPTLPRENIVVVPAGCDTLPTLAYAAACIGERYADATMIVLASDNLVDDSAALHRAFRTMTVAAQSGPHLVSLGIQPTYASTAYGYMRRGLAAPFGADAYYGEGYVEKPPMNLAQDLVAGGQHDWNSGMFAWDSRTFLAACDVFAPDHARLIRQLQSRPQADWSAAERAQMLRQMPPIAVDQGLLEKIDAAAAQRTQIRQVFVTGHFGWDDVGNYQALANYLGTDTHDNRIRGLVTTTGVEQSILICAPGYQLQVEGVRGLVIAVGESGDVLVARRELTSQVGKLQATPLITHLTKLGTLVDPHGSDADGNQALGAARQLKARACAVQNAGPGVVALLGVDQLEVVCAGQRVFVRMARRTVEARTAELSRVSLFETPETLAQALARQLVEDLEAELRWQMWPAIVLSAGKTPIPVYTLLAQKYRHALPWHRVRLIQMDAYAGLAMDDPRAFHAFLREALVQPLGLQARYLGGDERAEDMQRYEQEVVDTGGLSLVLHGVGRNGHLGFNEPGTALDSGAGRVVLAQETVADMLSDFGAAVPRQGVTLGLRGLNAARRVRVVMTGAHKRAAAAQGLTQPPSLVSPLSSLQNHADLKVFIDAAAYPGSSL